MGKITGMELVSDVPEFMAVGMAAQDAISKLPPKGSRTAVAYAEAFGFASGPVHELAETIDAGQTVATALSGPGPHSAVQYAEAFGLEPDSLGHKVAHLIDTLEEQAAS